MEYPEEIYATRDGGMLKDHYMNAGAGWGRRHAYQVGYKAGKAEQSDYIEPMSTNIQETIDQIHQKLAAMDLTPFEIRDLKPLVEQAFRAGLAHNLATDPLAGYSNLTAAISAGEPIDWEQLNGRKVQCVRPDMGTVSGKLERDPKWKANKLYGWWNPMMDHVYTIALSQAWEGKDRWTLWIEGEIPLVRKTADELEVGTYFLGKAWDDSPYLAYVGRPLKYAPAKTIYYAPEMLKAIAPPSEWEVLEEYGPFQKPEGK